MPGARPGISLCQLRRQARHRGGSSAATTADRPRADALRVQHVLGHPDLLLTAGAGRRTRSAVGVPRARGELQTAGEPVAGADRPVSARLALRDRVPVHAVCPDRRRRRSVRSRRRRHVGVEARRGRRRRSVRSRRRRHVGVEARRGRRGRSVRSRRRRRSVRPRRRRDVRVEARRRGGRIRSRSRRRRIRAGAGGRGRHQRSSDGSEDERLADVIQCVPFAVRARQSKPTGVGLGTA
jgi:hypothetical protein